MDTAHCLNLGGLFVGFVGAAWLWWQSRTEGGSGGIAYYADQALVEKVKRAGEARKRKQDFGFLILAIGFLLQGAALFCP